MLMEVQSESSLTRAFDRRGPHVACTDFQQPGRRIHHIERRFFRIDLCLVTRIDLPIAPDSLRIFTDFSHTPLCVGSRFEPQRCTFERNILAMVKPHRAVLCIIEDEQHIGCDNLRIRPVIQNDRIRRSHGQFVRARCNHNSAITLLIGSVDRRRQGFGMYRITDCCRRPHPWETRKNQQKNREWVEIKSHLFSTGLKLVDDIAADFYR